MLGMSGIFFHRSQFFRPSFAAAMGIEKHILLRHEGFYCRGHMADSHLFHVRVHCFRYADGSSISTETSWRPIIAGTVALVLVSWLSVFRRLARLKFNRKARPRPSNPAQSDMHVGATHGPEPGQARANGKRGKPDLS